MGHDALSPGHRWTTSAVLVVSRFVLLPRLGNSLKSVGNRINRPMNENVASGQGSQRVARRSHNLLLCPQPNAPIRPSVCLSDMSLAHNGAY